MANNKLVTVDILQYNNEKIKEKLNEKVNIEQDIADAGKLLGINETGNVVPVEAPDSVNISTETDNQIVSKNDGIYVAPTDLSDYTKTNDLDTKLEDYVLDEDVEILDRATVESMIGLSSEELDGITQIIDDEVIQTNKTYSSSKIYHDILKCLVDSKAYTLEQIGLNNTASYKVVSSIDDITEERYIYLLDNGTNFDMYIIDGETGSPVDIGTTDIDLTEYLKKADADDTYALKTDVEIFGDSIGDVANLTTDDKTVVGAINEVDEMTTNLNNVVESILDGTATVGDTDTLDGYEADAFLLRDGSVPMSGNLSILGSDGSKVKVKTYGAHNASFAVYNTSDSEANGRELILRDSESSVTNGLLKALVLRNNADGAVTDYPILHSGNVDSYALPISGGTLTSDLIAMNNGLGRLRTDRNHTGVYSHGTAKDYTNGRGLLIFNENYQVDDTKSLVFRKMTDGVMTDYTVVHSGNISDYALPLTGGTVTGDIVIDNGTTAGVFRSCRTSSDGSKIVGQVWTGTDREIQLATYNDAGTAQYARFTIRPDKLVYTGSYGQFDVLHTGNLATNGICTTTVADIALTTATIDTSSTDLLTNANTKVEYVVRNGICYINVSYVGVATTATTTTNIIVCSGIPKPIFNSGCRAILRVGGSGAYLGGLFVSGNTMSIWVEADKTGMTGVSSFSYPVSES